MLNTVLGRVHRLIGNTRWTLWLMVKLRNQVDAIIRAALNDGIDMRFNGEEWLIRQVAPHSRLFVDVGANVGGWADAFLGAGGSETMRGILFEPAPEASRLLREKFAAQVAENQIVVEAKAVADRAGQLDFFAEEAHGETSSLLRQHSNTSATVCRVEVVTLDDYASAEGIAHIDLLKVDAEGYDLKVLKGAIGLIEKQAIDVIQFEYNRPWVYAGSTLFEALSVMGSNGYQCYLLRHDGLRVFDYERFGDFSGYSNFVCLSPAAQERFVRLGKNGNPG